MIDFSLTEQQLAIQKTAKDFAEKEIKPLAAEIDRIADPSKAWNWEIYTKANQLGFNKILIPQKYGGLGLTALEAVIVIEELSVADAGVGSSYFVHNANTRMIDDAATEEQKQEFLTACCNDPEDRYFIAVAETEHGVTGDLRRRAKGAEKVTAGQVNPADFMSTTVVPPTSQREYTTIAKRKGDEWVINGMKRFITFGTRAKLYLVAAKIDPELDDLTGVATFFVPAGRRGLSFGHIEDKMGHRGTENAEVIFDDCRVPDSWKWDFRASIMMRGTTLNVLAAAVAVGIGRRAFEEAIAYAQTRYKYGGLIIFHQAVQRMLVDMAINVKTARLLTWLAAWQDEKVAGYGALQSMAKVYSADVAIQTTLHGIQVFGGYGYMRDLPLEKLHRDARLMSIYDGSNEALRHMVITPVIAAEGTA